MEQYFLNAQMTYEKTKKHFYISHDGYRTYFEPCMSNTIGTKGRFCICSFANKNFLLYFLMDTVLLVFFSLLNLIGAYLLIEASLNC